MSRPSPHVLILILIVVAAAGVRMRSVRNPLLDFHATRQYRSAIIARAMYLESAPGVTPGDRGRAAGFAAAQGAGEPPIMERLAASAYRLRGAESVTTGRALAAFFWLLGTWPLFSLARRYASSPAAFAAVVVYLFSPFAIIASTSFQPDPLMVAAIVLSALTSYRYAEQPTTGRLLAAAAGAGFAVFVKPFAAFFVVAVFVALAIARHGPVRALLAGSTWIFGVVAAAPLLVYYGYQVLVTNTLRGQLSGRFVPSLFGTSFFWMGWAARIKDVAGWTLVLPALAGLVAVRGKLPRALLAGLWSGYFAFAFVSNYHVATHDYYSLPLVPIVALSIAALVDRLTSAAPVRPRNFGTSEPRLTVAIPVVLVAVAGVWSWQAHRQATKANLELEVRKYTRIGQLVNHDTNSVLLDTYYGYPLMYHADVAGQHWPAGLDLALGQLAGEPPIPAARRFTTYAAASPRFFIVTDMGLYRSQPDLQQFLQQQFTVLREEYNYVIFDLRAPRKP